jgi:hypothetical protein
MGGSLSSEYTDGDAESGKIQNVNVRTSSDLELETFKHIGGAELEWEAALGVPGSSKPYFKDNHHA